MNPLAGQGSQEIDRSFIDVLHLAAQEKSEAVKVATAEEVGSSQGRRYLVISEGRLDFSRDKEKEVFFEDLTQFVNEKLKGSLPDQLTFSEIAAIGKDLRGLCKHLRTKLRRDPASSPPVYREDILARKSGRIPTRLSKHLCTRVFTNLSEDLVVRTMGFLKGDPGSIKSAAKVCKRWMEGVNAYDQAIWKNELKAITYGREAWIDLGYTSIGEVPPPPEYVEDIVAGELVQIPLMAFMKAADPFYTDGRLRMESQRLIYIPPRVYASGPEDEPENLQKLVQKRTVGKPDILTGFEYISPSVFRQQAGARVERGYWALVTVDVIDGSRSKSYDEQRALVTAQPGYDLPNLVPLSICVFFERIRTGKVIYGRDPWTYTRLKESVEIRGRIYPVAVGGCGPDGLYAAYDDLDNVQAGGAGLRKFFLGS